MKSIAYIKKVRDAAAFKEFMQEDPKAYLCSLFFTRDFNEKSSETQVDFYSPKQKMIVSFKVDKKVERAPLGKKAETLTHKSFVPKVLAEDIKMDIDEIEPTLMDEMHNRGMTYQIDKVLAFVNVTDNEVVWNCTSFLRGLGLLIAHVEDKSKTVLFMEKKSFFDILRFTKGGAGVGGQKNQVIQPQTSRKATQKAVGNTDVSKKNGKSKK